MQWQGCSTYGVHLACVECIPDVQRAISHFCFTGEVSEMNELEEKCDLDCGCRWDVKNLTSFVDWLCAADARTWKPIVSGKAGSVCICAGCLINWGNMRLMDVDQQPILPECVKNVKDVPTWDIEGRQILCDFLVAMDAADEEIEEAADEVAELSMVRM